VYAKAQKTSEWLSGECLVFTTMDCGDNLTATKALIQNHGLFEKQMELQRKVPATIRDWLSGDKIELHEGRSHESNP
jgi:triphosphoribosyl-dephospho-CoA synthetase